MGNASTKDEGGNGAAPPPPPQRRSGGGTSPPASPRPSASPSPTPFLFVPQVPAVPFQRPNDAYSVSNHPWMNDLEPSDDPTEKGIPILITWNHGGTEISVEGSWDNWSSRKTLEKSGKVHAVLMVLPSGVYHYKFFVDGEFKHSPDFPCITDERGQFSNVLDVHDYVPENIDGVSEFEAPPSPYSSYDQLYPGDEDFAKEPPALPQQLLVTVLGSHDDPEESSVKPQHVVLNHLFIEKGWTSQSLLALGLTHRFQSKYVTVVLYKPLKR
ncbi:SNF1-related protein kinase regulatory subunit beta-1 [Ananas comosus]|uniref:SNF1-related protein kinase regulatory subunit beta-1 n=1 Tax=Ananas comosus TaxID=4615 RepID=A0A199UJ82_ANACO|nr:SNF1-related protein kinase regulatory subunit beta-1 [Ananas comosus]